MTGPEAGRTQDGTVLLRRMATYLPGSLIPAIITLLTSVIFTRIFDTDQMGVYSLALVVANMVKTALTVWLVQSIGKYLPAELEAAGVHRVKGAIFLSAVITIALETLLAAVVLAASAVLFDGDAVAFTTAVVLFVMVSSAFDVLSVVFPAEHRAREYVGWQLAASAGTLLVRLLMVWFVLNLGITIMFWSAVIVYLVVVPMMWRRGGLPSPWQIRDVARSTTSRALVKAFAAFGMPMTLWLVATLLLDVGDRFVIEFFEGPGQVGIYDANYRLIVGGVALLVVPVTIALHPYLMRISGFGVPEHIAEIIGIIVENLLLLGTLSVGLVLLFHQEIALLLGPDFRSGSAIMPVVLAGVFAFNIGTFAHKPFEIIADTRPMVLWAYVAAAVNVALCFLLVPLAGLMGAAVATLLAYVLYTLAVAIKGRRIFPWRIQSRVYPLLLAVIAGVAAIGILRLLLPPSAIVAELLIAGSAAALLAGWVLVVIERSVAAVPRVDDAEFGGS